MEFRILGPLEVRDGERVLPLGGVKRRAVLAVLLLDANRVVSVEGLVDRVWGDSPPPSALASLQNHLGRLRRELGDRLVRRPPGYLLRVADGERDLDRFQRLVDDARGAEPAVAAERLAEALALWRGPPLADLAGEPAAGAAAPLEDLRLAALEERIEADLALGRHAAVVPELEELVAREPYRERLRGQLIVALYRSGRQADALEAYARARRAFVDELGTEPSRPLQELQRAVLNRDPALEAPAGVEPPPVRPPRAEERRTVTCSPPTSRPTICLTIRKRVARCCANEASWQRSCSRPTARQCRVSEAAGCSACSAFPLRATRTCCKPRAQQSRCARARASDSPPVRW